MKRALLLLLALLLGMIAASPAMAVDWSAQGAINILSVYYKNMDLRLPVYQGGPTGSNDFGFGVGAADPQWNKQAWWLQNRMQLFVTGRASQDLYGTIAFEIQSSRWGENDTGSAGYIIGKWNADPGLCSATTLPGSARGSRSRPATSR